MPQNHLVTIIVPIHNAAPYLVRCLDSLCQQTYKNLEIILVDDGSTDNSLEICQQYALKDTRIQTLRREAGGVSVARNTGLSNVHGDFVTFVDADDWLDLQSIRLLLHTALVTQAEIVWAGRQCVRTLQPAAQSTAPRFPKAQFCVDDFLTEILHRGDLGICNKFFCASLLKNHTFNPRYTQSEDFDFLARLLPQVKKPIPYVAGNLYFYYQHPGSARRTLSIQAHQYNYEIGQKIYEMCQTCRFEKSLPAVLGWWISSAGLYGICIILLDADRKYNSQLKALYTLFKSHRRFIFTNRVMWKPAQLFIILWLWFPSLLILVCRLPGIRFLLKKILFRKLDSNKG